MEINHNYLMQNQFQSTSENGRTFYNKNRFIVSQSTLGWEQFHDLGPAAGFVGCGLCFANTQELEHKYKEDLKACIDSQL